MFLNKYSRPFLALFLGCIMASAATGQDTLTSDAKGSHSLYFHTSFDINSTCLTNQFLYDFYDSRYLTYDLRKKVSARIPDIGIAGYRMDAGLYYFFAPESFRKKVGYYIGVEHHSLAEIRFNRNFFDLIFFGNEDFAGQKVNLSGLWLNAMDWQQFKAGIFKAYQRGNTIHQVGFGLAWNKGQRHQHIDVQRASFFTHENAEYIELDFDLDVCHTDSSKNGFFAVNGYGISLDLAYNYTDRRSNEFQFRISNIGYIRWDKSPDNYRRDTVLRFDGFEGVFTPAEILWPAIDENTGDSISRLVYGSNSRKPYTTKLPLDIDLKYNYTFPGKRITIQTEFRLTLFSLYQPRIILKPGYTWFRKKSSVGLYPVFIAGGYGNYNAGLCITGNFGGRFYAELGAGSLNSLIFPGKSAGLSGSLSLYKMF
jgi:hypothetical protein